LFEDRRVFLTVSKNADGYRHDEAQFGQATYNKMITQKLYYSTNTLCESDATAEGGLPSGSWVAPYILMVDRGDCTFVTKAKNAQRLGASALVVADNVCLCDDGACSGLAPQTCAQQRTIMADDGTGSTVSIPSILMQKSDADIIKHYLYCGDNAVTCPPTPPANLQVQASLEYTIPDPDERVEWALWTTSVDDVATNFVEAFKDTAVALGEHQFFTPHFYTYNGSDYGCRGTGRCANLCTNNGRYCAPDPDGKFESGISGADVVAENLRRTCVWRLYGSEEAPENDRGLGPKWWDYVTAFAQTCMCDTCSGDDFASAQCISSAMQQAAVDEQAVTQCMTESGGVGFENDVPNTILDAEIDELNRNSIYQIPQCIVNNKGIVGAVDTANVLNAICEGFSDGDEPWACDCLPDVRFPEAYEDCIATRNHGGQVTVDKKSKKNTSDSSSGGGIAWWAVLLICLCIILSMTAAGVVYWKSTQTQMRDQVRGILAEYLPLEDGAEMQPTTHNALYSSAQQKA